MSEPNEQPETVTLTCPDCGEEITGAARGKGSASWRLGTHRYTKHKTRGTGVKARSKQAAADTEERIAASPVLGVVRDIRDAIGDKKGTPSHEDLAKGLGRGLTFATIGAATLVVDTDARIGYGPDADAVRSDLIDRLSLPERAAVDVMSPIARMLAPSKLNARYGRAVVDNVDVLGSFFELAMLMRTWSQYLGQRRADTRPAVDPSGGEIPGQVAPPLYTAPASGYVPTAADLDGITTPPPQSGHVMTAADIEAMQRRGAN